MMKIVKVAYNTLIWIVILTSLAISREGPLRSISQRLDERTNIQGPTKSLVNINHFDIWVRRDGFFPWDGTYTGTAGAYPAPPSIGAIFTEGILWGAKVSDGGDVRVRVNGSTYISGMKAGKVIYDPDGNVIGSGDPSNRHIWRVRRDYLTADLTEDAASFFVKDIEDVTEADIQVIYDQYEYDWGNWPADEGAPFEDVDVDGVYNPTMDLPGYPGASQTIWLVANDVPLIVNTNGDSIDYLNTSPNSYGSPPIGIEMQMTLWGYDATIDLPIGNGVFKLVRLIYTGLVETPDSAHIDTMYFTQFVDPDIGQYTDDFVGCDTSLDLGYAYNGDPEDAMYADEGYHPPAIGYTILQGPIFNGNPVGMTSFFGKGSGSAVADPNIGLYSGTLQWFNLMEGFLPRPEYPEQVPWTDPLTGDTTKFTHYGDPVTGTGWIDGIPLPPGDRRFWMTTGPFSMTNGDTQEVVIALIGALGTDYLNSITVLRNYISGGLSEDDEEGILLNYSLSQNYPNPFNSATTIEFSLPTSGLVTLSVYDILGRKVETILNQRMDAGHHSVQWVAPNIPTGIYFMRMQSGNFSRTRKVIVLK